MYTRDLQNGAGNQVTPRVLVAEARKLAKRSTRISVKIIDEKEMKRLGMGLLLSVSQGSSLPAYLIHLTYKPRAKKPKGRVCFVGKGLTFDAGGLSIKPSSKMDEMRYDMSGGAAVLGAFHALGDLDVAQEVHGLVPASENVINGVATKPGDIHRADAESAATAGVAQQAQVKAEQLPGGVQAQATGHHRVAFEVAVEEPKVRANVQLGDDFAFAVAATGFGDMSDAIHHQHIGQRQACVAGAEQLAVGTGEQLFALVG